MTPEGPSHDLDTADMSGGRLVLIAGALALAALLTVGLIQLAGRSPSQGTAGPPKLTPAQMQARLVGSPRPVAALHAQANELLSTDGGALQKRLATLHGWPVVINKWASWCEPCRSEFGAFQHAAVDLGRRVAFIGLDSRDSSRGPALRFMRSFPLSYPSYYDGSGRVGVQITDSSFTPVTVFYSRHGSKYIHQGPYPSAAKLERDIERYALGA
jgi:cytochrome c biogenesis protein CcmG, thiol:disulfide interchange protein DsbE